MTVNTTPVEINYTGNASTTVFALPFAFAANAHVKVYLDGVLQGSGYSITGAGNPSGGTLTMTTAPGSGVALKARRVTPLTQDIDVVNNATVFASSLETGLDYALMRQQEEAFDRIALGVTFAIDAAAVDADAAAAAASAASALAAKNAAETAETNAETAETAAETAAAAATAAVASASRTFETKAAATAALAGIAADTLVRVMVDESRSNKTIMYKVTAGALVLFDDEDTVANLIGTGVCRIGDGRAISNPPSAPTLTEGAAGSLTGTYRYAYTESDGTGTTALSPVSSPITVAAKKINVSVPGNRRGTSQRQLYRTVAGGSVYKLVKDFDGGDDYYRTEFIDDVADGSLGANAPSTNTTYLSSFEATDSVKFFRTNPDQGDGTGDLTVLTGNGALGGSGGAYSIDFYGPCLGRTRVGTVYQSRVTGNAGMHFLGYHVTDTGVLGGAAPAPTLVYQVGAKGNLAISPLQLSDPSLADGASLAFSLVATMPSAPTATSSAMQFVVTGAGAASFTQTAMLTAFSAGYTGNSATYAQRLTNSSAHTGISFGLDARATGAAALSIGVAGFTAAGTKTMGVFGSADGTEPSTAMFRSGIPAMAGAFTNGSGVGDIIVGLDGTTPVFYVENGGDTTIKNVGTNGKLSITNSGGGGVLELSANGGNDVKLGSTNNVPTLLRANGATVITLATGGSVGINESVPDYKLDVNGTFGFTPGASVTPVDNGDVVFELTSNTSLTVKAKGSDGTVRSVVLTLA